MDLVGSSGVKGNSESPELTRNSSISVTIDDLTEGLIVVSFSHSDNLYQGVLFQLNRERGIPSGISFAKEHALGSTSEKSETDGGQSSPLHQRHTYNQGIIHGAHTSSLSQPSLRRIIKPPARFKNARMSLRLRARPVLCGKCRSLCDEKADSKDDNQTEKTKKETDHVIKMSKPQTQTKTTISEFNHKLKGAVHSETTSDPKDLCYESVRSTGVVENFWKRPLVKPLIPSSEEAYARLRKHKLTSSDPKDGKKRVKISQTINSIPLSNSLSTPPRTPTEGAMDSSMPRSHFTFLTKSTACDNNFPNTRSRKSRNLKMCITKITDRRNGINHSGAKHNSCTLDDTSHLSDSFSSPSDSTEGESSFAVSATKAATETLTNRNESRTKSRGSSKSKAWEHRIRTQSTVPVRYRDDSYDLTKNIFNFNKRRPVVEGSGEIPVLTICRSDVPNTFKVSTPSEPNDSTVTTSRNDENEYATDSASIAPSSSQSPSSTHEAVYLSDSSSANSPSSSSVSNFGPPNFSIMSTSVSKPPEVTKTPTIKITFGSSGNGMVVQIPPKTTQQAECTSTTEIKASRKALKKAKKEAKRKRSMSPQHSPSINAMSPHCSTRTERSNPPSPISHNDDETEVIPDIKFPVEENGSLTEYNTTELSPSNKAPKKKKKQKKRRRNSKTLKENDGFTSSSSSHDVTLNLPSPNSNVNQNNEDSSPCSPTSGKSLNDTDVSNSENHDVCHKESVPQRVCINLKRIDTNAYIPLPQQHISTQSNNEDPAPDENNGVELDESDSEEFPVATSPNTNEMMDALDPTAESVNVYRDKERQCTYEKGDVVWGKLPACPWWPGKIVDILNGSTPEDMRAKVSWFKSTTQSYIRFKMILPFFEYFDNKFTRTRRRGAYQLAVRDALMEAHNPGRLTN